MDQFFISPSLSYIKSSEHSKITIKFGIIFIFFKVSCRNYIIRHYNKFSIQIILKGNHLNPPLFIIDRHDIPIQFLKLKKNNLSYFLTFLGFFN